MSFRDILRAQLLVDEGKRTKIYFDSLGVPTAGVGRNMRDKGLREDEIALMLENDMTDAADDARALFPNFDTLSDNRKAALANMALNLGRDRLKRFAKLIAAVAQENFDQASTEMLSSSWSIQVGPRATRLAKHMREG